MLEERLELDYLREAVPLLGAYLLSREPAFLLPGLSGRPELPYSQLTLGPLLLMLKRLKARGLTGSSLAELGRFEEEIFQVEIHNESAWKKKAGQDLANRARLWGAALEESRKDVRPFASTYPNAVSQRVILHLLWEEMETGGLLAAPMEFMLQSLDAALKVIFIPNGFLWEPALEAGFPKDPFWYLYGKIK